MGFRERLVVRGKNLAIVIVCEICAYVFLEAAASFFIKRFREPARRRFYADHLDPLHIRTQIENLTSGKNKAFTEKKHTYRYAFSHFSWTVLSVSGFLLSLFSIPLTYW